MTFQVTRGVNNSRFTYASQQPVRTNHVAPLFFLDSLSLSAFLLQDIQEVKKVSTSLGSVPLSRCGHHRLNLEGAWWLWALKRCTHLVHCCSPDSFEIYDLFSYPFDSSIKNSMGQNLKVKRDTSWARLLLCEDLVDATNLLSFLLSLEGGTTRT